MRKDSRISRRAQPPPRHIRQFRCIKPIAKLARLHDALKALHAFECETHPSRNAPRRFIRGVRLPLAASQAETAWRGVERVEK